MRKKLFSSRRILVLIATGVFFVCLASAQLTRSLFAEPLDEKTKQNIIEMDYKEFLRQSGLVKVINKEPGTYKGQAYTICKDADDPNLKAKVDAVNKAVKTVIDKGVNIPPALRVYCLGAFEAQNRSYMRDEKWNQIAYITLGSKAVEAGQVSAISSSGFGGFEKPTITTIHEIGHILHERVLGDDFFAKGSMIQGKPVNGAKVSVYASGTKKEFVAEVFAGLIIGMKFPAEVMEEYKSYRGPAVP